MRYTSVNNRTQTHTHMKQKNNAIEKVVWGAGESTTEQDMIRNIQHALNKTVMQPA